MRYDSGLVKEDIKLYFLRHYFLFSILLTVLLSMAIIISAPSSFKEDIFSIVVFFFLLFFIIFIGSFIIFLNHPFAGVMNILLRHELSDYNVEVDEEKITIQYSYLTREGLNTVDNTIYLKDIVAIEPHIQYGKEFSFIQRWKIFNGYQFTNLPPGIIFNPIIDKSKVVKIILIRNYDLKNYIKKSGFFRKIPELYSTDTVYIEMDPIKTQKFINDVRGSIITMNNWRLYH